MGAASVNTEQRRCLLKSFSCAIFQPFGNPLFFQVKNGRFLFSESGKHTGLTLLAPC